MSLEQSDAIVLRVYPWSETSCVAAIYTRDFGKVSAIAKGARRPKSPFEAALDLLSICRVVFISKTAEALDILTEAKLQRRFRAGSADLLRLYCGYYVAELLDRLTDRGDAQPEVFDLAIATLDALETPTAEPRAAILRFELGLLRLTGNLPSWRQCAQCGKEVNQGDLEQSNQRENASVAFGVLAGGVLCSACRPGARQIIRMPCEAMDYIEQLSNNDWQSADIGQYLARHRAAVRGLLNRYLTTLLDRKLQLHAFLEELGR